MRIALAADELTGVAEGLPAELRRRGHEPVAHGVYAADERPDWAWAGEAAARGLPGGAGGGRGGGPLPSRGGGAADAIRAARARGCGAAVVPLVGVRRAQRVR